MLKIGDKIYYITHAYYHYVGEITEILGVRRCAFKNVVQIHSDSKNWTEFFKNGITSTTKFDVMPDSPDDTFFKCFIWKHKIPKEKF